MSVLLELAVRFFLCGLFAIGGGLATLPFLYDIAQETGSTSKLVSVTFM